MTEKHFLVDFAEEKNKNYDIWMLIFCKDLTLLLKSSKGGKY